MQIRKPVKGCAALYRWGPSAFRELFSHDSCRADGGNATPVHSTKVARRSSGQGQGAYCRSNSVRADHEIIVLGRAIGEPDRNARIVLHHGYD